MIKLDSTEKSFFDLWIFKFIFCGWCALKLGGQQDWFLNISQTYSYNPVFVFELLGIEKMSASDYRLIILTLCFSLASAALGFFSRTSLAVAFVSGFLYFGSLDSFLRPIDRLGDSYNHSAVLPIIFILLISRGIGRLDFHRFIKNKGLPNIGSSVWEVSFIKFYIGFCYFLSFLHKMIIDFPWADGTSQQAVLFRKGIEQNLPHTLELAENYYAALFSGIGTLILEGGFIVFVFIIPFRWLFVSGGLGFHYANYYYAKIGFLTYYGYMYVVFIPDFIRDLLKLKAWLINKLSPKP